MKIISFAFTVSHMLKGSFGCFGSHHQLMPIKKKWWKRTHGSQDKIRAPAASLNSLIKLLKKNAGFSNSQDLLRDLFLHVFFLVSVRLQFGSFLNIFPYNYIQARTAVSLQVNSLQSNPRISATRNTVCQ